MLMVVVVRLLSVILLWLVGWLCVMFRKVCMMWL